MNIRDFSKICDCSTSTVANAFSHPERVKEATLARIKILAEEHRFRPNRASAAAFNGKTRSVGVMLRHGGTYHADIARGIQTSLFERDYIAITFMSNWQDRLPILRRLIDQRVDGLILFDPFGKLSHEEEEEIKRISIPYLFVDTKKTNYSVDTVTANDHMGGGLAVDHLLGLGHRKIAIVAQHSPLEAPRLTGMTERLKENGVKPLMIRDVKELVPTIKRKKLTALLTESDLMASICYQVVLKAGLKIPDDISVVGFADLDFASLLSPPLTTIDQKGLEVGRLAGEIMLERLKDRSLTPVHKLVPVSLVERESTLSLEKNKQ